MPRRGQYERRLSGGEVPLEHPRGGEILDGVQTTRRLFRVEKPPVPLWVVPVAAIGAGQNCGERRVWPPDDAVARGVGVEAQHRILVMQRVDVPSGDEWSHRQTTPRSRDHEPPGEDDRGKLC